VSKRDNGKPCERRNVDIFVAIKASNFNAFQQPATTEPQTVQSKASKIHAFPRISTNAEIWFGTREPNFVVVWRKFYIISTSIRRSTM
jgi:hypothetical protein